MDHFQDLANVPRQLGTIFMNTLKGGLCPSSDESIFLITELAHEGEVLAGGVKALNVFQLVAGLRLLMDPHCNAGIRICVILKGTVLQFPPPP